MICSCSVTAVVYEALDLKNSLVPDLALNDWLDMDGDAEVDFDRTVVVSTVDIVAGPEVEKAGDLVSELAVLAGDLDNSMMLEVVAEDERTNFFDIADLWGETAFQLASLQNTAAAQDVAEAGVADARSAVSEDRHTIVVGRDMATLEEVSKGPVVRGQRVSDCSIQLQTSQYCRGEKVEMRLAGGNGGL